MELFELIQTLNTAHGPSGDEGAVREAVAKAWPGPTPTRWRRIPLGT